MTRILHAGADVFPPYQYRDASGQFAGIDYDKVRRVLERMGCEMDLFLHPEWTEVQKRFDAHVLDLAFQVQPTPERLKKFFFSDLLREAATELVSGDPQLTLRSYGEIPLKGLKLGVLAGYTNGPDIDALPGSCKTEVANTEELLKKISSGEVDLGVVDQGVKGYLMKKNGISNIYAVEGMTFTRPLHVIFNDADLRDEFNAAMAELDHSEN